MKQHITTKQLNELSDKDKERLRDWWVPKKGDKIFCKSLDRDEEDCVDLYFAGMRDDFKIDYNDIKIVLISNLKNGEWDYISYKAYPLFSIGQMIEFLTNNVEQPQIGYCGHYDCEEMWGVELNSHQRQYDSNELVDALWGAVKDSIKRED